MRPRPNDRGNGRCPLRGIADFPASMRPRPNDRGNYARESNPCYQSVWLQWGGGRTTAEVPAAMGWSGQPPRFNEAAAARPRKFLGNPQDRLGSAASMRPRPNDRGNLDQLAPHVAELVASMRPRPNDRGNRTCLRTACR